MKISYNWLKQYINVDLPSENIAQLLTNCGLEVESAETVESVKGGLKGVVIGEVITCRKHPDSDHLSITTVDIGQAEHLHIVCGAPNVSAGQKVAVATIGTTFYKGDETFQIKKSKIRGELSEGMICAEDELGLGTSHDGIMVLDPAAVVGTPGFKYFNVSNDTVFEIGLTANRSDATSHIGVARDLVAVLNAIEFEKNNTNPFSLAIPSVENFSIDNHDFPIDVKIEDVQACPRYSGLTISGVEVKESPDWLKKYLHAIGIRSINNLVDISNFILFETGQPMHFFDADQILGKQVIIKKLPERTKFITLDEKERTLTADNLMICNAVEGMCIAGVFGGQKTGVTEKTKNIFLESAYFNPVSIRKTSKYHGLKTDASFRYERGADPNITIYALKRAALLIKEIAGGKISSGIVDVYPNPIPDFKIELTYQYLNKLVGKIISPATVKNILTNLKIEIVAETSEGLSLSVPPFRADVQREADVVEEILRIYGYNNIETGETLKSSLSYYTKPDKEKIINRVSDFLTNNGFSEMMLNSLTKSEYSTYTSVFSPEKNVKLSNPLSKELDVMRQTLLFGGLEAILFNQNRKITNLKVYEFGSIYRLNPDAEKDADVQKKYIQNTHLALYITGKLEPESWRTSDEKVDFFNMKMYINLLLQNIGFNINKIKSEDISNEIFEQGLTYQINREDVVQFGSVSPAILKRFDIKQPVFYADFNWDVLFSLIQNRDMKYAGIPKFQEVRRDLALLVNEKVTFAEIEKLAYRIGKPLLKKVSLFDVYKGNKIDHDKKSYAVSFNLLNDNKTMNDKEIDSAMEKLMLAFQKELGAEIR